MNVLASLIFRNYTYRLTHESFSSGRETYSKVIAKMLSKKNGAKLMRQLQTRNNTPAFNEIIALTTLFYSFVTSTSFPPTLNQIPPDMTRMVTSNHADSANNFLAGAMLSLHDTENIFLASKLRNFALMYAGGYISWNLLFWICQSEKWRL